MNQKTGALCILLLTLTTIIGQTNPQPTRPPLETPLNTEVCREEIICRCSYDPATKRQTCVVTVETSCD
jgi:hypothetical protein